LFTRTSAFLIFSDDSASNKKYNNWYTRTIKLACEHEDVTVLWNQDVHTDRRVITNRPDIIIKNRKEKTYVLIDVAIPADRNIKQKGAEKKLKYNKLVHKPTITHTHSFIHQ
jgi:hypothetical protein